MDRPVMDKAERFGEPLPAAQAKVPADHAGAGAGRGTGSPAENAATERPDDPRRAAGMPRASERASQGTDHGAGRERAKPRKEPRVASRPREHGEEGEVGRENRCKGSASLGADHCATAERSQRNRKAVAAPSARRAEGEFGRDGEFVEKVSERALCTREPSRPGRAPTLSPGHETASPGWRAQAGRAIANQRSTKGPGMQP